ncbi:hypothetical protein LMG3458_02441 [Achromobacter deleyi]|uniref:Uncharacterized protein n=1 Tax=Achromobacter deleyi TaxID=1353891 RepID=A0A6S6ZU57_9BURK|nr:hypothetical protein [Achromobacter deleyi]CAB3697030.1 hypothetical protein LMG3458_02441 [Achromobacter deleyi]
MAYISKDVWAERFKGWLITGCAVRNNHILYLCARQDIPEERASSMWDSEIPSRLVALFLDDLQEPYAHQEFSRFNKPKVGVAIFPLEQGLLSSDSEQGAVWVMGSGGPWPMEYIDESTWPSTRRLKCIDGYTYSVCLFRDVYKRIDMGEWVRLDKGLPEDNVSVDYGFKDIDAFSDTDFYAVGGCGDVWRYDGDSWSQCRFPSDEQLSTVTCAPDGNVYIGGEGCSLWMGREHSWQKVARGGSTILWNESVWFQDKLWLSSDYQLRVWDGQALQLPMDGDNMVVLSGHIDARDGVLVVASSRYVDMFDGEQWHSIVEPY